MRHGENETEAGCWPSQGSVSLSTQHVLITSVSDRTTASEPPTLVLRALSVLLSSVIGEHPVDAYEGQGQERDVRVCVCVCVAVGVHSGGQSIDSAGESVVTCKQGREVLVQP